MCSMDRLIIQLRFRLATWQVLCIASVLATPDLVLE